MFEAGPERERPRVGAFFDMDKTLIAENSGSLFMRHQYEQGEIDGFELLKGFGAYVQYKLGVLDIANWTRKLMLQFAGRSESDLERQTAEWFEDPGDLEGCEAPPLVGDRVAVDLASSGGHEATYRSPAWLKGKVMPWSFVLRHYPIRSQAHGVRKVFTERKNRWNATERKAAWHAQYDDVTNASHSFVVWLAEPAV